MARVIIFDSGVGGLSIFDQVAAQRPDDDYLYLFDNACFPYGELTKKQICRRTLSLLQEASRQFSPDLIVIGCNSASTSVLPLLRRHFSIPIVGVVPAIKPAAQLSKNRQIGLVATPATVKRSYTHQLISDFAHDCQVHLLGSTELVHLAERKLAGGEVTTTELEQIFHPWLILPVCPDVIVLGCTHFPHLKREISQLVPGAILIDSGEAIAKRVEYLLVDQAQGDGRRLARYTLDEAKIKPLQNAFNLRHFSCWGELVEMSS